MHHRSKVNPLLLPPYPQNQLGQIRVLIVFLVCLLNETLVLVVVWSEVVVLQVHAPDDKGAMVVVPLVFQGLLDGLVPVRAETSASQLDQVVGEHLQL